MKLVDFFETLCADTMDYVEKPRNNIFFSLTPPSGQNEKSRFWSFWMPKICNKDFLITKTSVLRKLVYFLLWYW